jgi:nicotinate-nucleotide adenylyltransferase
MRIALFGGTFDPPHRGHIAVAKAAADAFGLDQVLLAPTGLQPLKLGAASTAFGDRMALVAAACKEDARFSVSDIDAPRADYLPNYTVDTLDKLRAENPAAKLFNLVGADSFLNLRRWHEPDRLLELAEWIVVTRPGYPISELDLSSAIRNPEQRAQVHVLRGVEEDLSATDLRARLRSGDPCPDLLPEEVGEYIKAHNLYR